MRKFKQPDPVAVEVDGETLLVHPLNAGQFAGLLAGIEALKKSGEAHKADFDLLAMCVRDAGGAAVFASAEEAGSIPLAAAARLLAACLRINGMGQGDEKKA